MRKRIIFTGVFLFCLIVAHGQGMSPSFKVFTGAPHDVGENASFRGIILSDETGTYTLRSIKKKGKATGEPYTNLIDHYSPQLNHTKSVELEIHSKPGEWETWKIKAIDKSLFLIKVLKDPEKNTREIVLHNIDKQTLKSSPEKITIDEVPCSGKSCDERGGLWFRNSPDQSQYVIAYSLPYDKKQNERMSIHVIDENTNRVWNKMVTFPYPDSRCRINSMLLDEAGNVYMSALIWKEKKARKKGKPVYQTHLFAYRNNGTVYHDYVLDQNDDFLRNVTLGLTEDNHIQCTGVYSSTGYNHVKGVYLAVVDPVDQKISKVFYTQLSKSFVLETCDEEEKKILLKKKTQAPEKPETYVYQVIPQADGGMVYIMQEYKYKKDYTGELGYISVEETLRNRKEGSGGYEYYNDLLIVSISAEGEIEWNISIPKVQYTSGNFNFSPLYPVSPYASIFATAVGEDIYIFFNDKLENYQNRENPQIFSLPTIGGRAAINITISDGGKGTYLGMVAIAPDGTYTEQQVLDYDKDKIGVSITKLFQTSAKEMILQGWEDTSVRPGQQNYNMKLGKITFE